MQEWDELIKEQQDRKITPAVKKKFSEALGRELFKTYSEREGLHDGRELANRAMA